MNEKPILTLTLLSLILTLTSCGHVAIRATQAAVESEENSRKKARQRQHAAYETNLTERYPDARQGDILRVQLKGGKIDYGTAAHPDYTAYDPVNFHIARGESLIIPFYKRGKSYSIPIGFHLSEQGDLYFDATSSNPLKLINRSGWNTPFTKTMPNRNSDNARARDLVITLHYIDIP